MKKVLLAASLAAACTFSHAELSQYDIATLQGYSIIGSWHITGWYDPDTGKKGDAFEGCEFGRVLILDDRLTITCNQYRYHYAYRPTVIIYGSGSSLKMVLGDDIYNMIR